jgi:parallel beta helix pectate lyase-like protein
MWPPRGASARVVPMKAVQAVLCRRPALAGFLGLAAVLAGTAQSSSTVAAATTCALIAAPSSFDAQVSAASPGQTVCLASGDYGVWRGTAKAITIRPEDGATPLMVIQFGPGASGFTIDGGRTSFTQTWGIQIKDGNSPDVRTGAHDITIENTDIAAGLGVDQLANANIVFNHDVWHDLNGFGWPAGVHLDWTSSTPSGVTVENSLFRDMSADGIQTGSPMNIVGNEFSDVKPTAAGGNESLHTDAVQLYGGTGVRIQGNFVHGGCEQGITAFDGTSGNTVEDNVIVGCTAHSLVMSGDKNPGSLVDHNTVIGTATAVINCSSKTGEGPSTTMITNNIASGGLELNDRSGPCQPAQNTNNLLGSGGHSPNFSGTPTFVGGANPTTYAGYQLAPGSRGKGAATDGLDVGARITTPPTSSPPPTTPPPTPHRPPAAPFVLTQMLMRSHEVTGFAVHGRPHVRRTIRAFLRGSGDHAKRPQKRSKQLKASGFIKAADEQLRGPHGAHGFSVVVQLKSPAGARHAARYLFQTFGVHARNGRPTLFRVSGVPSARGAIFGSRRKGGVASAYWVSGRCVLGASISRRRGPLSGPVIAGVTSLDRRTAGKC